eukprot:TRINITY_DN17264_c0_g1_i1.p1 TRINITY_DN17264_c0_g1~~TRINITY_DN17264_c0_g1_i1.p1  ORF type:complete len:471 (-),score=87.44 TRINITY_DN17264_c0_g1_i1:93-1463(-)
MDCRFGAYPERGVDDVPRMHRDFLLVVTDLLVESMEMIQISEMDVTKVLRKFMILIEGSMNDWPCHKPLFTMGLSSFSMILWEDQVNSHCILEAEVISFLQRVLQDGEIVSDCFVEIVNCFDAGIARFSQLLDSGVFESGLLRTVLQAWRTFEHAKRYSINVTNCVVSILLSTATQCKRSDRDEGKYTRLISEYGIVDVIREIWEKMDLSSSCDKATKGMVRVLNDLYQFDRMMLKSVATSDLIQKLKESQRLLGDHSLVVDLVYCLEHFVPSAIDADVMEYFSQALRSCDPVFPLSDDVIRIIVEYATEGYRVGQHIDVYENSSWCAAVVTGVNRLGIEARLIGWDDEEMYYYEVPSNKLALGFTHTTPVGRKMELMDCGDRDELAALQILVSDEPCLGNPSLEQLKEILGIYLDGNEAEGFQKQSAINHLRFLNRYNLETFFARQRQETKMARI